mmetsp:Transcript_13000/g.34060  ORF Transcript_13000/g.34060 Transcript_13000/m.34060 type:complete len:228 (+) Transcript_13000:78-761(+)
MKAAPMCTPWCTHPKTHSCTRQHAHLHQSRHAFENEVACLRLPVGGNAQWTSPNGVADEPNPIGPRRVALEAVGALRAPALRPRASRPIAGAVEASARAAEGAAVDGGGALALDGVVGDEHVGEHHRPLEELRQPRELERLDGRATEDIALDARVARLEAAQVAPRVREHIVAEHGPRVRHRVDLHERPPPDGRRHGAGKAHAPHVPRVEGDGLVAAERDRVELGRA